MVKTVKIDLDIKPDQIQTPIASEKENVTQNKIFNFNNIPDTLDETVNRINEMTNLELKNANFEKNNNFGEKEMWLDQKDAFRKPVFSKVVTEPYSIDFLKINLKSLLNC